MYIRKATLNDLDGIMGIYAIARKFMAEHGNPKQWGETNWPPESLIRDDILKENCHVLVQGEQIHVVFYNNYGHGIDPTYDVIEDGRWIGDENYGVVHRIASDGQIKGAGKFCIEWAFQRCGHLRMDTHGDNYVMQSLLAGLGFARTGIIHVEEDNYPRIAFEKVRGADIDADNAFNAIVTRRSTRKFKKEAPDDAVLASVLEAGRHAPSGHNQQSTHIIVLKNREVLKGLADLVEQVFAGMELNEYNAENMKGSIEASRRGGYVFHYNAPVLVITANKAGYENAFADCACVLENMMIEANALGLGTCWINQLRWLKESREVRDYLAKYGLAKDERVYGSLAIGLAETDDGLPLQKERVIKGNPITIIE